MLHELLSLGDPVTSQGMLGVYFSVKIVVIVYSRSFSVGAETPQGTHSTLIKRWALQAHVDLRVDHITYVAIQPWTNQPQFLI